MTQAEVEGSLLGRATRVASVFAKYGMRETRGSAEALMDRIASTALLPWLRSGSCDATSDRIPSTGPADRNRPSATSRSAVSRRTLAGIARRAGATPKQLAQAEQADG